MIVQLRNGRRVVQIEKPLPPDVLESPRCPVCASHRLGVRQPDGTRRFVCNTCRKDNS